MSVFGSEHWQYIVLASIAHLHVFGYVWGKWLTDMHITVNM